MKKYFVLLFSLPILINSKPFAKEEVIDYYGTDFNLNYPGHKGDYCISTLQNSTCKHGLWCSRHETVLGRSKCIDGWSGGKCLGVAKGNCVE